MTIISSDNQREIYVGNCDILHSLYSTIKIHLDYSAKHIPLALKFLETKKCDCSDAMETARQFNLIRDELSRFPPSEAVYDMLDRTREAPWKDNLSGVITSCANLYTTEDGKDLLYEIVSILSYAGIMGSSLSTL